MRFWKGLCFVVLALLSAALAFDGVRLYRRQNSRVTSSTLTWAHHRRGDRFPPNAVHVYNGGPLWCRARERSLWLSGAVVNKQCRVAFLGKVHVTEDFNVLVSLNGSARLVNETWDSFQVFPDNALTTPDVILALTTDLETNSLLPGFADERERRAYFLRGDRSLKSNTGTIVVEKEPISYKLHGVELANVISRTHEEIFQEFILKNPSRSRKVVSREISFLSPHVVYYGKMQGTITDLPTNVSGPDVFPVSIKWGYANDLSARRRVTVRRDMPANSKVRVIVTAVVRILEATYYGTLTSTYDDRVQLSRKISGIHTERKLAQLKAEFDEGKDMDTNEVLGNQPPLTAILLRSTTTTPASPKADLNVSMAGRFSVFQPLLLLSVLCTLIR